MIAKVVQASLPAFAASTSQRGFCSPLNMRDRSRSCEEDAEPGKGRLVLHRILEGKGGANSHGHPPVR